MAAGRHTGWPEVKGPRVEATLTEVPGIGPWTARGFLLVALDRPDVFLTGDLALRRTMQRAAVCSYAATSEPWRCWNWATPARSPGGPGWQPAKGARLHRELPRR